MLVWKSFGKITVQNVTQYQDLDLNALKLHLKGKIIMLTVLIMSALQGQQPVFTKEISYKKLPHL